MMDVRNTTLRRTGPTLSDLDIQPSIYGGLVPIHFGTVAAIGIPIDLDRIKAHEHTESSGGGGKGGGGGGSETTTTTYTASVAIMFGEGVCLGIRRIWMDGKLWFAVADDASAETIIASSANSGTFKFYSGTETQLPDPTLEAMHGVGNVSAYRGEAYVVFTDNAEILNGNALRQLKFELVYSGSIGIANRKWGKGPASAGNLANGGPQSFIESDGDEIIFMRHRAGTPDAYEVWSITPVSQTRSNGFSISDMSGYPGPSAGAADEVGHLRAWLVEDVFQGVYRWIRPDGSFASYETGLDFIAFEPVNTLAFSKLGSDMLLLGAHSATVTTYTQVKLFHGPSVSGSAIPNINVTRDFVADLAVGETIWAVVLTTTSAWVMSVNSAGAGAYILRKCSLSDLSTLSTVTHAFTGIIPGGTGEQFGSLFAGDTEICLAGDIFYMRCRNPSAAGNYFILKVDADGGISIEGSDGIGAAVVAGTGIGPDIGAGSSGVGAQVSLYGSAFGYNPSTKVATFMANENLGPDYLVWPYSVNMGAISSTWPTDGEVIAAISQRAGYTPEQIDVAQMTDPLHGYSILSVGTGRTSIEPLCKYGLADPVDSDGKTKYIKRGGPPLFTVNFDDLCAHEIGSQMPEPFAATRRQELELPRSLVVNFKNPLADYDFGSERSPQRATLSQNDVVDDLPIVMLPQKAAELASALYFDQIIQRTPRTFYVLKKFEHVEPTDPGWVEYPRGTFNPVRIVKREENGPVLKFDSVPEDADAYTPNVVASSVVTAQTSLSLRGPTTFVPLDIPILRDADDDAGFYAPMSRNTVTWSGAVLARSIDDVTYADIGTVTTSAVIGWADTVLADWTGGNVFDEIHTLDVSIGTVGALSSATRDVVLDTGANAAVVGSDGRWEIIQFRAATLVSPNKYRLSSLLRGRRGTEWAMGTHTIGDRFALLGTSGTLRPNEGNMALNSRRYYKPVSIGRSLAKTYAQQFTNTGVGLKPFSPVNLRGTRDGSGNLILL